MSLKRSVVNMNGDTTMRNRGVVALFLTLALTASCSRGIDPVPPETIIGLERGALDRWGKGDPQGYAEAYAPEITYFDPFAERRIDGIAAVQEYLRPITGKVHVDNYEMIDPKVQQYGDVAVLTYNLVSHAKSPAGQPIVARWNSTQVYRRSQGKWAIIHNHWSFTKPVLGQPVGP
jgi:ketosteroid isomerase-like protein